MPASQYTLLVRDYSDEYSAFSVNIPEVTALNHAASLVATAAIEAALVALTTGNVASKTLSTKDTVNDVRPANPYAQRETGLRLFYQDDVTAKKYHVTVPAPDLTLVASGGSDDVDLFGVATVNAIVQAMEGFVKSPEGNDVTFYKGTIVGRRS